MVSNRMKLNFAFIVVGPLGTFLKKNYDNVLMMVGLSLTFFLLMNAFHAKFKIDEIQQSRYAFQKWYLCDGEPNVEDADEISKIFRGYGKNCILKNNSVIIGDTYESVEVFICLSGEAFAKKIK